MLAARCISEGKSGAIKLDRTNSTYLNNRLNICIDFGKGCLNRSISSLVFKIIFEPWILSVNLV